MNAAAANPSPSAGRRIKKRYLIPSIVLGVLALVILAAYIRGSWADTVIRNPSTAGEGIITQLYQGDDGRKVVRCAVLLDYPIDAVWQVVTGYERFPQVFATVQATTVKQEQNGCHHLLFELNTPIGVIPIDTHITHEETAERKVARWDEPSGDVLVNRGSWTLTAAGPQRTLLVYMLEAEVRRIPTFLIRNVLLSRQPSIAEAVRQHLASQPIKP